MALSSVCHDKQNLIIDEMMPPLVLKRHGGHFNLDAGVAQISKLLERRRRQLLPAAILHDEARADVLDRPGRREAAIIHLP